MRISMNSLACLALAATLGACSSVETPKVDTRTEHQQALDTLNSQDPKAIKVAFATSFDIVLNAVSDSLGNAVEKAGSAAPAYAPLAAPAPSGGQVDATRELADGGSLSLQGSYSTTPGPDGSSIVEFSLVARWSDLPVEVQGGTVVSSGSSTLRGSVQIGGTGSTNGTFEWQGTHTIDSLSLPFELEIVVEGDNVSLNGNINGETLSFDIAEFANDSDTDSGTDTGTQDTEAPETLIGNAPQGNTAGTSVELELTCDDDEGCTFECKVDFGQFESCESPLVLENLGHGNHTVAVRASDAAGNTDQTPAVASWRIEIDALAPETTLIGGPDGTVTDTTATIGLSCNEDGCSFECSLDGADFAACSSPLHLNTGLGSHTLVVRAIDGSGNYEMTPVSRTWLVWVPVHPQWIDVFNSIYFADTDNCRVRKIDGLTGYISTIAGNGSCASYNGDDIDAVDATLYYPRAVALDIAGNVYVTDYYNHRVRKIDALTGMISTVAGNGNAYNFIDGSQAVSTTVTYPMGIFVEDDGDIYVTAMGEDMLMRVDAETGLIHRVAGSEGGCCKKSETPLMLRGGPSGSGDGGLALDAYLNGPNAVVVDPAGDIYISDGYSHSIRKINSVTGIINRFAGTGYGCCYTPTPDGGFQATESHIGYTTGLLVLDNGDLLFSSSYSRTIRRVSVATGVLDTIAGVHTNCCYNGDGMDAMDTLMRPTGLAQDNNDNLIFLDTYNNRIRSIDANTNIVTTIAGNGNYGFSGDGTFATEAELRYPGNVDNDD